jgi:putative restriction endonuclease
VQIRTRRARRRIAVRTQRFSAVSYKYHKNVAVLMGIVAQKRSRPCFTFPRTPHMQCWIAVMPPMAARQTGRAALSAYTYATDDRSKKNVAAGDLLFLRDQKQLLAVAQVEDVTITRREQAVPKCPVCAIAKIEKRKRRDLPYRCFHGHQFATPAEEHSAAVVHTAAFPQSCARIAASIEAAELRPFELTNSRHVKLKAAELVGLCSYVARRDHTVATLLKNWLHERTVRLDPHDAQAAAAHSLMVDEQERPFEAIRMRRGISAFRDKLISRYGARCMISGCNVLALLEACHVGRYQGPEDNHPANGILLRSDLHTLFDLDLIGLNPTDMEVTIHADLLGTEYEKLAGARLLVGRSKGIDMRAVRARWKQFTRGV